MDQPGIFDGALYSDLRMRGVDRLFHAVSFERAALACLLWRRRISDNFGIFDILDYGKGFCGDMVRLQ